VAWQARHSRSLRSDACCAAWRWPIANKLTPFGQAAGQEDRGAMSVSEEGKRLAPVAKYWSNKQFAVSPRADHGVPRFRSHFSQESTPKHPRINCLIPHEEPVEFVMRGHAVILAAALAWFISIEGAEAKLDILVDKATQRMLVIQDGFIRYKWPVSTGRDNMQTPNGVYAPQRLERNWFSTAYYDSPMPFSIFFHNGYAIHGSYAIDRLGGPASHGCVRLHPHHAAVLFDLVQQEGPGNTTIEVTDDGRPEERPLPGREIAAGPGREIAAGPGRDIAAGPGRDIAAGPGRDIAPGPGRDIAPGPGREIAGGPGRYIAVGPGENPPMPRMVRYRETGDMPDPLAAQRANRPIAARNGLPLPPRLGPGPAARRLLADVRPSANLRAPGGAGMADTANASPRAPRETSDSRPKPKTAEGPKVIEGPKVVEGSSPEPAQPGPSTSSFKLLPASCWSGGASRWQWWASSQANPCK
jgi:lipoprotein-anchoring transpeptidase ErfK/SrfK